MSISLSPETTSHLLKHFPAGICAFDMETTGLTPVIDRIIEIAAIKITPEGEVLTYQAMINPQVPIPEITTNIHQITDDMVRFSPTVDQVLPQFLDFIGDTPLLAHNAIYDVSFLTFNLYRLGMSMPANAVFCSCQLGRQGVSESPNYKLSTLMKYFDVDVADLHRALNDSKACLLVMDQILLHLEKEENTDLLKKRGHLFALKDFEKHDTYKIPEHLKLILSHLTSGEMVEIEYKGGSVPQRFRPIRPINIIPLPTGMVLRAWCGIGQQVKSFLVKRIRSARVMNKVEQAMWSSYGPLNPVHVPGPATSQM